MSWKKLLTEDPSASDIASSPSSGKVLKVGSGGALEWATDAGGSFTTSGTIASFSGTEAKVKTTTANAVGVILELAKDSASPATNDEIGKIAFNNNIWDSSGDGELDGSANFAQIIATATNVESGAIAGKLEFKTIHADTLATRLTIESSGNLTASADSDKTFSFGRAKIFSAVSDYMYLSHHDLANGTNYALKQNSAGATVLNSKSGSTLSLSINNTNEITIDDTKTTFAGYAVFGSGTAIVGNNSLIERMAEYQGRQGLNQKIEMHSTGDVSIRSNSTDDALYIKDDGKIAIGHNTPATLLDLKGSTASTDINIRTQDDTVGTQYEGARVRFAKNSDGFLGHVGYRYYSATDKGVELSSSDDINFRVAGSDNHSMRINSSGIELGRSYPFQFTDAWTGIIKHGGNNLLTVNAGANGAVSISGSRQVNVSGKLNISSDKLWMVGNNTSGNVIDMHSYGGVNWDLRSYYDEKFIINYNSGTAASPTYSPAFVIHNRSGKGKIGIGVATPTTQLHVEGNVTGNYATQIINAHSNGLGLMVRGGVSGSNIVLGLQNSTQATVWRANLDGSTSQTGGLTVTAGDIKLSSQGSSTYFKLEPGGTTTYFHSPTAGKDITFKLRKDSSEYDVLHLDGGEAKVGVRTTSPSETLDVAGTINATNYKVGGAQGSDGQVLTSTGSGVAWEAVPVSSTSFTDNISLTKSFPDIFTKSDNEGRIGFMDAGGAIQSGMKNASGDLILIADGNTERVRINSTGVGIGTNNPYYQTDIRFANTDTSFSGGSNGNWGSNGLRIENTSGTNGTMSAIHLRNEFADIHIAGIRTGTNTADLGIFNEGSEKMRITSAGNVGIGTTNPIQPLHIYSNNNNSDVSVIIDNDNESGTCGLGFASGVGSNVSIGIEKVGSNFAIEQGLGLAGSGTRMLTITPQGGVGIGTTAPATDLHVASASNHAIIRIEGASNKDATLQMFGDRDWILQNDGDGTLGTADYFHLYDLTAGASRLVVDTSGKIGLGTNSPVEKLDVRGDILSTGDITILQNQYLRADNSAGAGIDSNRIKLKNSSTGNMEFTLESNDYDFAFTNGRVGVGTSTPDSNSVLHIVDGAGTMPTTNAGDSLIVQNNANTTDVSAIYAIAGTAGSSHIVFGDADSKNPGRVSYYHNSDYMSFHTNTTEQMRISSAGNVGIGTGTTNPTQKLVLWGQLMLDSWIRGYEDSSNHTYERYWMNFNSGNPLYRTGGDDKYHKFERYTGDEVVMVVGGTNRRVGIGTTNPTSIHHVHNSGAATGWTHYTNSNTGATSNDGTHIGTNGVHAYLWNREAGDIYFGTSATTRMIVKSDGKVGIGTASPQKLFHLSQSGSGDLARFESTGGTFNIQLNADDSGSAVNYQLSHFGNKFVHYNNGNIVHASLKTGEVGIGTDSPLDKLHIVGSNSEGALGSADSNNVAIFQNNLNASGQVYATLIGGTTGYAGFHFGDKDDSDAGVLRYDLYNADGGGGFQFWTEGSERMCILANGNVGIGTTSPDAPLHVVGAIRTQSANNNISWYLANNTTRLMEFKNMGDNSTILKTSGSYNLRFGTADVDRMIITSGGAVGIGTTSPQRPLHIHSTDATATLLLENTTQDASGGAILNSISFNHHATLNTNLEHGSIGYYAGETWDDTKFYQTINNGNTKQVIAENIRGNTWKWYTGGTERMQINSSGYVGIGTDSPSSHLHVKNASGGANIFVDGDAGAWQTYAFKSGGSTKAEIKNYHETRMEFKQTAGEYRFNKLDGTRHATIDSSGRLLIGRSDVGASDSTAFSAQFTDTAGTNAIHQFGQHYTNYRAEGASIQLGRHGGTTASRAVIADTGAGDGTVLGSLNFRAYSPGGGAPTFHLAAQIQGVVDGNFATNSAPGALVFLTHKDWATSGNNATERMRLTASGRLGVGTNAPESVLHAEGAGHVATVESTNTYSYLQFWNTTSGKDSTNNGLTVGQNALNTLIVNREDGAMYFSTNDVTRMTVHHDGLKSRIGINTTSPTYALDIINDGDNQFRVGRSASKFVRISDDVMAFTGMTGNGMRITTTDSSALKLGTNNLTGKLTIGTGSANVGIGTYTTSAANLTIDNSGGYSTIRLHDTRTGDTSVSAGGMLRFYASSHSANKHLGDITYHQTAANHGDVEFKIAGTLAGVGSKTLVKNRDNGVWYFYTTYEEDLAMVIKDQKVGIGGTSSPGYTFDCQSTGDLGRFYATNGGGHPALYLENQAGSINSGTILQFNGGSASGQIKFNGISSTTSEFMILTETGGNLTEKMRIDENGLVGIGTGNNASHKLHVEGESVAYENGKIDAEDNSVMVIEYIAKQQTTNDTETELFLSSGLNSGRMVVPDDATWFFSVKVVARRVNGQREDAGYHFEGVIENDGGTTALVGSVQQVTLIEDQSAWSLVCEADDTNNSLKLKCRGENSKDINWVAHVRIVQTKG